MNSAPAVHAHQHEIWNEQRRLCGLSGRSFLKHVAVLGTAVSLFRKETISSVVFQISALRQMNLPQHRKHIDLRKTYSAPFHFPFHSAFTQVSWALIQHIPTSRPISCTRTHSALLRRLRFSQGWSLYAETLGRELGMTGDPYNEYGLLYSELYQTARVVVDTGIHAFGWVPCRFGNGGIEEPNCPRRSSLF